jgi:DNA-binding IclR family transcriptional regulator
MTMHDARIQESDFATDLPQRASADDKTRISNRPQFGRTVVKSAGRVLEILEYFDDVRRPANVIEVASALGYPQSSTSVLLRSLVNCGYLAYDRIKRTYITSGRVSLLGQWANPSLVADGPILQFMHELNDRTGQTIMLAGRNGLNSQYVHVMQAKNPHRAHITLGTVRPLAGCSTGVALLSALSDAEVTRIVMRSRAEADDIESILTVREALALGSVCRRQGYLFMDSLVMSNTATLTALLPTYGDGPFAVGIGGMAHTMTQRREEFADILKDAMSTHFGVSPMRFARIL